MSWKVFRRERAAALLIAVCTTATCMYVSTHNAVHDTAAAAAAAAGCTCLGPSLISIHLTSSLGRLIIACKAVDDGVDSRCHASTVVVDYA